MMGRQVQFVFDLTDGNRFLDDVHTKFDGVLLEWRAAADDPVEIERLDGHRSGFLCRRCDVSKGRPRYIAPQRYWVIGPDSGPVVEWGGCNVGPGLVGEHRLYFWPRLPTPDGGLVDQDLEFVRFAERLFRLARNRAPLVQVPGLPYKYGLGASIARRFAAGEVWCLGCPGEWCPRGADPDFVWAARGQWRPGEAWSWKHT